MEIALFRSKPLWSRRKSNQRPSHKTKVTFPLVSTLGAPETVGFPETSRSGLRVA